MKTSLWKLISQLIFLTLASLNTNASLHSNLDFAPVGATKLYLPMIDAPMPIEVRNKYSADSPLVIGSYGRGHTSQIQAEVRNLTNTPIVIADTKIRIEVMDWGGEIFTGTGYLAYPVTFPDQANPVVFAISECPKENSTCYLYDRDVLSYSLYVDHWEITTTTDSFPLTVTKQKMIGSSDAVLSITNPYDAPIGVDFCTGIMLEFTERFRMSYKSFAIEPHQTVSWTEKLWDLNDSIYPLYAQGRFIR